MIECSTDDGKNEMIKVPVNCRLDNEEEVSVYEAGGLFQRFAPDSLKGKWLNRSL